MANSIFLARLMGPVLLVAGIALCIDRKGMRTIIEDFLKSPALIFLSGFMIMPAGLAIVLIHNAWGLAWPVIITLVGWLMLIGGALRILIPGRLEAPGRAFLKMPYGLCIVAALWIAAGITLCIFGYFR